MTDQSMYYAPAPQQQPGQHSGQQPQQPAVAKKGRKRGFWAVFFLVLCSPFIALYFVFKALYWVFLWLMTPVALVVHFVLCAVGLVWYTPVKLLASGRSKYRLLQPHYPGFPPFWSAGYWVRLRGRVKQTCEFAVGLAEIFSS
jgi:hypothetical protein